MHDTKITWSCVNCKSTDIVQAVWIFANSEELDGGEVVDEINMRCWDCGCEDVEDLGN
jgi:hypothetical protein